MPHQHRSPRQPRRHLITHRNVCRANRTVTRELETLGFWHHRLDDVEVQWVPASLLCYGWYQGNIEIPAVTGAQLADLVLGRHTHLTDILRHEWAHAVADKWPHLINTQRFAREFGGPYESVERVRKYDPEHHLTRYAATTACEDFAEVFHCYLRHKGRLPRHMAGKPVIAGKWRFVEWLACRISRRPPQFKIS